MFRDDGDQRIQVRTVVDVLEPDQPRRELRSSGEVEGLKSL